MSNYGINKGKRKRNIYILSIQKGAMKVISPLRDGGFPNGKSANGHGFLKFMNAKMLDIN